MDALGIGGSREPREVEDLKFYFQDLEAAIGYRSLHGAMIDRICGVTGTSSESMTPFEGFSCWSNREGQRAFRVRAALRGMVNRGQAFFVTVLHRVYGQRSPHAPYAVFGEIAPIAEYTATVEGERERLVRTLSDRRIAAAHRETFSRFALDRIARGVRISTDREITRADAMRQLFVVEVIRRDESIVQVVAEARALLERARAAYAAAAEGA